MMKAVILASGGKRLIRTEGSRTTTYELIDAIKRPGHDPDEIHHEPRAWNFTPRLGRNSEFLPSRLCGAGKAEIR